VKPTWRAWVAHAALLGLLAVGVGAASGALAAAAGGGGSISACVHKAGGGLYRAVHCAKHDGKLTWNVAGAQGPAGVTGPAGSAGATGPQGAQGPPGGSARAFAFVNADGTVVTKGGSIDIAIDKVKTGEYCLKFNPDVNKLFAPIVATIQGPDLTPALISVNTGVGSDCNPDGGAGVFTMNTAGAATDHQFTVALF
jgi:hypothetical protein